MRNAHEEGPPRNRSRAAHLERLPISRRPLRRCSLRPCDLDQDLRRFQVCSKHYYSKMFWRKMEVPSPQPDFRRGAVMALPHIASSWSHVATNCGRSEEHTPELQ